MKKIDKVLISLFIVFALIFFISKSFALLESDVKANARIPIGKWNILVNNTNLGSIQTKEILIDNVMFESNEHTASGVVAPGMKGEATITIDPNGTDVAFLYNITYEDKNTNSNAVLNVTNVSSSDGDLTKTGPNTYTGLFTLNKIRSNKKENVKIELEWINDESNNDFDSLVGTESIKASLINLEFEAIQYNGESIVPYVGE